jgi:putative peptide zinc metalloprotease protein
VVGNANYVVPVNRSAAVNDQCAECLTFASATQIVVGVDGPVVLTSEGRRRLNELRKRMADLESRLGQLTAAQLATEVSSIEQELISILKTELVPAGSQGGATGDDRDDDDGDGEGGGGATTTTARGTSTPATTVTTAPVVTTTTANTEPSTAPTTTAAGG